MLRFKLNDIAELIDSILAEVIIHEVVSTESLVLYHANPESLNNLRIITELIVG